MTNMKKSNIFRILIFSLTIICITASVFSEVLVNTSVDKESISQNEVAIFTVRIFNDSKDDITNYYLKLQTTDNLVFTESEQSILAQKIDLIRAGTVKEIKTKFKAINMTKDSGNLYAYYGDLNPKNVSGTFINTKQSGVSAITSAQIVSDNSGDKIVVTFEMHDFSGKPIYNVIAGVTAPSGFDVLTKNAGYPIIPDTNSVTQNFEVRVPLSANGSEKVTISYGYFDDNSPHYFEETHTIEIQRTNNYLLGIIGIVILIIAVFIYLRVSKKGSNGVKGTAEKAKEEK